MAFANIFGETRIRLTNRSPSMSTAEGYLAETSAPTDRDVELLDARELPPPKPLRNTLETLAECDDRTVVVQLNDRAPQHLYPQLTDRGYEYETLESEEAVVTVIWRD